MSLDLDTLRGRFTIADGAWGTLLQARGVPAGRLVEAWNFEQPDAVRSVAAAYCEAGSQIVYTNTFRANRFALAREQLADRVAAINTTGARLSREAAEGRAWVFGSIGPSGKLLLRRQATEGELLEAFREQAQALSAGGADAIVCETFFDLAEISLAIQAAKETGLPVLATMTFDSGADKTRTMMGAKPEQAATALLAAGADALGCNCGVGIEVAAEIIRRMRAQTDRPLMAKPNAGMPEMSGSHAAYRQSAAEFAAQAAALRAAGADIVGGCCGTTPEFIRELRATVGQGNTGLPG